MKIKNKKSIKITALVDDNKIPYVLKVTSSRPHDAKIMESTLRVDENNFDTPVNIIGDKGSRDSRRRIQLKIIRLL